MPESGSWRRSALKDLVDERGITYGVVQPGQGRRDGVPMLRVKNFGPNGLKLDDVLRIDPDIEAKYTRSRLRGGEVLITLVGSVGLVSIAPQNVAGWNVARAVGVIPVRGRTMARWVDLCLRVPEAVRHLNSRLNTTVQKTLNLKDLAMMQIPLPPAAEMERIVSLIAVINGKIDSNARMCELLDAMARTIYVGAVASCGNRVPLSTVAMHHKESVQPSRERGKEFEHFSIPAFDSGVLSEICVGETLLSGKYTLPADAVAVSKLNPATKRVLIPQPTTELQAICSSEFVVLRPVDARRPSVLRAMVAYDDSFYRQLLAAVTGTTGSRQRVKPGDVLTCTVPAIPESESALLEERLAPLFAAGWRLHRESHRLRAIRDELLPKLVSGKIRVPLAEEIVEAGDDASLEEAVAA